VGEKLMTVSEIDDGGNENYSGDPERKDACHDFPESHKVFQDGFNQNRNSREDFQSGYNERKDGRHENHYGQKDFHYS
jgi:hypothetical protein